MTLADDDVPNEETDLEEAKAIRLEGKGTDELGEKETNKQPNEPTNKPHA